jgi:phospholipase C
MEENKTYAQVYPDGMPWLVAQGNKYGHATNYHADVPGSMMDYLWLSSGNGEEAFGCVGDGCSRPITSDNIFRELGRAGLTWKVYAQSLPSAGYMGPSTGAYETFHNPARWYSDVIDNPALQQNMVPLTQLAADVAANNLPNYSIIIPDGSNDGWNGSMSNADNFLATNVAPLLNTSYFGPAGDALMFITFDECDEAVGACPNNEQVYTAVIGPKVRPGVVSSTPYKHENMLRTILDALGVSVYPGASSSVADMTDFF